MTEPFTRLECYNRLGLRGHLGRNPHLVEGLSGDRGSRAASPSAVPEAWETLCCVTVLDLAGFRISMAETPRGRRGHV